MDILFLLLIYDNFKWGINNYYKFLKKYIIDLLKIIYSTYSNNDVKSL